MYVQVELEGHQHNVLESTTIIIETKTKTKTKTKTITNTNTKTSQYIYTMGIFGGMMKKETSPGDNRMPMVITTTAAVKDFYYGIPLESDITDASLETLLALGLLVVWILVLQPRVVSGWKSPVMATVSWLAILASMYAMKHVTAYPIVTTILRTRTIYPYPLVVAHCINANASYRQERGPSCHYLESYAMGFLAYGFGGTIVSDVLMGLPITALQHVRILPVWTLAWMLIWFCPSDYLYRMMQDKKNSYLYYFINVFVAMDVVTTSMGRVSRSARELSNQWTAPIVAGTLSGIGDACIRYLDRRLLREGDATIQRNSLDAIEIGFWRTLGYSTLWWYFAVYQCNNGSYHGQEAEHYHCREYTGHDDVRIVFVMAHVVWTVACDLGLTTSHPFIYISRHVRHFGSHWAYTLGYGPPQWHRPDLYLHESDDIHEKTD